MGNAEEYFKLYQEQRVCVAELQEECEQQRDCTAEQFDRAEAAERALRAILDIHDTEVAPHTYCRECAGLTPCETVELASAAMQKEEK